jgi:hypothetical protein
MKQLGECARADFENWLEKNNFEYLKRQFRKGAASDEEAEKLAIDEIERRERATANKERQAAAEAAKEKENEEPGYIDWDVFWDELGF